MKALIVYDSTFGHTEKIARAIGGAISTEARILRPGEANPSELESLDLLVVGSPTHFATKTRAIQGFLNRIPANALRNVSVASFDTRFDTRSSKLVGYAAGRISSSLKGKGGHLIAAPEGFIVEGRKGPLKEGELERAANWGRELLQSKKNAPAS